MPTDNPPCAEMLKSLLIPSTATLTAVLQEYGLWNTFMKDVSPITSGICMAGPAFTMRYIPAREDLTREPVDNLTDMQRIGIERIEKGEILVVDARGKTDAGIMGDILATRIKLRGAAGIVTDGAFRDTPGIVETGLATYASGMNAHNSKTSHYPSDIQQPIACGGIAVFPGDIIVGDAEGVVVIPRHLAEEVAEKAVEKEDREVFLLYKIQQGHSIIGVYPPDENTLAEYEAWKLGKA